MLTMLAGAVCACSGDKGTKAIDPANFDNEIALEQDFYEHFTGGWQKLHPLKPEYSRYGAFDVVRENNEVRINELFTELAAQTHESGSVAQKIADLYNLGMDSVRLNSEAAQPVMEDLARIREVSTAKTLAALVADMHTTAGSPFFMPFVDADLVNPDANALYLYQAGLGMDNKEYYLETENERILNAYKTYVTTLFELAGFSADAAAAAMENVLAVEMEIAKGSLSQVELRDIQRNYNPMSVEKLKADYRQNTEDFARALRVDTNFDIISRRLPVGADEMTLFYIDGFVKDGVMQRLMQYFLGLSGLGSGEDACRRFADGCVPYVEVSRSSDALFLRTMVLSGATVLFGSTFGAEAIVIDARTYPAREPSEP